MAEKEKTVNYHLNVVLSQKRKNGVTVSVSTECASWEYMQKFLSDFEDTLQKGNNGKS